MILGVCLEKQGFRAAWLDGTKAAPTLADRERCLNPSVGNPTLSAGWLHGRMEQILRKRHIDGFACKISYDLKSQEAVLSHGAPLGIICFMAHTAHLPLELITKTKLKSVKTFGLPKGIDPYVWIDMLKDGGAYWDAALRDAVLAATAKLP